MKHEIACSCGNVLTVPEDMDGSSLLCGCGRTVLVPAANELPVPTSADTELPPGPTPLAFLLAPTQATLRSERCGDPGRFVPVMAALTADALWIQEAWRLRWIPLRSLGAIETRRHGK